MKKRHYIELVILLIVAFIVFFRKSDSSVKSNIFKKPTQSVMSVRIKSEDGELTTKSTTVSLDDQEIKIERSDYETEADYQNAIKEAKAKLGFRQ